MKTSALALLACTFAVFSWAAETAPATSPVLNEKKPSETAPPRKVLPPAPHALSTETSAKIRTELPPNPTKPTSRTSELVDLREIDKPRNTIPRLPREMIEKHVAPRTPPADSASLEVSGEIVQLPSYIVKEDKVPNFKDRDTLTPQGKLDLAYKRHPGLKFNPLFFLGSNDGVAMAMLEEEFRLERMKEMQELSGLYSDPKTAAETKRIANEASLRHIFSSRTGP